MVLRCSDRISRVPPYLIRRIELPIRGCHPLWPTFPGCSCHSHRSAGPRSLAATRGVSVDFLSSGYLDVSVPRVCLYNPMYSGYKSLFQRPIDSKANNRKLSGGLPHSEIVGSKPILGSPTLIAEYHVLHRLLLPRHPPNALFALDLIQKKTGFFCTRPPFVKRPGIDQKHTFPLPRLVRPGELCRPSEDGLGLVYLTWISYLHLRGRTPDPPHLADQ